MTVLTALTDLSTGLIRAEVLAAAHRERLLAAARQAVMELGVSANEVSAATGLTLDEIAAACAVPVALDDDLAKLAGLR
jgi:hypothetical protein